MLVKRCPVTGIMSLLPAPPRSIPLASEKADFGEYALVVGREAHTSIAETMTVSNKARASSTCWVMYILRTSSGNRQLKARPKRSHWFNRYRFHGVLDGYAYTDRTVVGRQFCNG